MGLNKKRKLENQPEEIAFDPSARQEFLTGFRKRKLQRVKHAQQIAEKRAREERVEDRKRIREERKAEYQRAFEEHQRQLKILNEGSENDSNNDSGNESNEGEDEEWEGFAEPPAVDYEAEYIDEDKYTTVTVEEMDPSREGLLRYGQQEQPDNNSDQDENGKTQRTPETDASPQASAGKKKRPQTDKPKKKKKKFRYESKEERKLTNAKQRLSKARKAKARRGEE